jgi:hypothetical protein
LAKRAYPPCHPDISSPFVGADAVSVTFVDIFRTCYTQVEFESQSK